MDLVELCQKLCSITTIYFRHLTLFVISKKTVFPRRMFEHFECFYIVFYLSVTGFSHHYHLCVKVSQKLFTTRSFSIWDRFPHNLYALHCFLLSLFVESPSYCTNDYVRCDRNILTQHDKKLHIKKSNVKLTFIKCVYKIPRDRKEPTAHYHMHTHSIINKFGP